MTRDLDAELRAALAAHRGGITRRWADRWAAEPDRPAVWTPASGWMTAGELDAASRRAAATLHAAGLRRGDRALISAGTSIELVVAHVAALRLGAVVVPANTAYKEGELAHLLRDARPTVALLDDPTRRDIVRRLASAADGDPGGPATGGDRSSAELIVDDVSLASLVPLASSAALGAAAELDGSSVGDDALICYTSGTTGAPKGAVHTHGSLVAAVESLRLAWQWTGTDTLVCALPLFHVHGLQNALHCSLTIGTPLVLLPRFDVDGVLDALRRHSATMFFGVPTMYARFVDTPAASFAGIDLRLWVSGSAPLAETTFEAFAERTGQIVLERYGMTEGLMLATNPYDGPRRPGTVGMPFPGVELRLADGERGEVLVRGPNMFRGYWGNDAATAAAVDADGWFHTGDVGELDDGSLRLVGRTSDLIISGGFNIYPREVEEVVLAHPGVREAAVVGVPSEEWGETVVAFVVVDQPTGVPFDTEGLRLWLRDRIANFKVPRRIDVVDELPRNALGKTLYTALRDRARQP